MLEERDGTQVREAKGLKHIVMILLLFLLLEARFSTAVHQVVAYAPQNGDYFDYSETITINNGAGSYSGYTDQTATTGAEQIESLNASIVTTSYRVSYQYSNDQGSSTSSSSSGVFSWSSSTFEYVNGTDDQVGYSSPVYVWFAMNPSLPVGATFQVLNTQFTVLSKNSSLQLPSEGGKYVQTIQTKGTGQYQRNDSYGVFTASYTWIEYFDPSTGYIVAYNYVEQDTGQYQGQPGSFTYSDNLYVTQTSYGLTSVNVQATTISASPMGIAPASAILAASVVVVFIIAIAILIAVRRGRRRRSIPEHTPTPAAPPPPSPAPMEPKLDLGSRPPEQVVIREVAKVNCKYCGTLIPTTVDRCPHCGAPRE